MINRSSSFNVFAAERLSDALEHNTAKAREEIDRETDKRIVDADEAEYVKRFVGRYTVAVPEVDFDSISAEVEEREIPVDAASPMFYIDRTRKYRRPVVIYHLPFTGDVGVFRLQPGSHLLWTTPMWVEGDDLCFEIVASSDDPVSVNSQKDEILGRLRSQLENVQQQLRAYNAGLASEIERLYRARKQRALSKQQFTSSLDVPLRKEG